MLDKMEKLDRPRPEHTRFKLRLRTAKRGGNIVLDARGLSKKFGDRTLFGGLDVELSRGDKVGIVGPNGAGKTTLLKILAGKLAPDAGKVRLGSDIDLGYFDQELDFVGDSSSVLEEIWRMDRTQSEEAVRTTLGAFGFGAEFVDRPVRALSGGQRSRLGLLKMMLMHRNFLVLDEPTNHLDLDSVGVLEDSLRDYEGTLLMVSHDRQLLSRAVHKLIVLAGGHCRLFDGGYEEYVQSLGGAPLWSEITAFEAERAARQAALVPAKSAGKPAADAAASAAVETAAAPASKNAIAKLRKRFTELEDTIVSLEVDLEEAEHALSQAHTLRPEEIEAAGRRHAETQKLLQERYAEWNELSEQMDAKKGGK
jgi:ATP-binding cassette subfamily F protein 3